MRISLTVLGDRALARKVDLFGKRGGDMRPIFRQLITEFHDRERDLFSTEGGGLWAQLQPSTVAERGSAHPILVGSGALQKSLTQARSKGSRSRVRADQMFIGTSIFYAKFHQGGTEPPGATKGRRSTKTAATGLEQKRMPARLLIVRKETLRRAWLPVIRRYLKYGR